MNTTLHIPSGLGDDMNSRDMFAIIGGSFFVYVGILHFTDTEWFEPIVPPFFGSAKFWVILSGIVEIAVGILLIIPSLRKVGGFASAAMLVWLYPANLYMWISSVELGDGESLTELGNLVRLTLQLAGIWVSLWIAEYPMEKRTKKFH